MVPMQQPPAAIANGTTDPESSGIGRNGSLVRLACQTKATARKIADPSIARISGDAHAKRLPPHVSTSITITADAISSTPPIQSTLRLRWKTGIFSHLRQQHCERERAKRKVDPEDHRPVQMFCEQSAEHRSADCRLRPTPTRNRPDIGRVRAASPHRKSPSAPAVGCRRRRCPATRAREISVRMFGEIAHSTDPIRNSAIDTMIIARRP